MSLNGELSIQLNLAKQGEKFHFNKIDINLARPNLAPKMLVGQTPECAVERITQLMTVCQHAQTAAAKLALGYQLTDEEILAIEYENIEQGFWRLVIDLPKLLEIEFPLSAFLKLRQAINQQQKEQIKLTAEQLFLQLCQLSSNEFAHLSNTSLSCWLNESDSVMAHCLRQVALLIPATPAMSNVAGGHDKSRNGKENKPSLLAAFPDEALLTTIGNLLQAEEGFYQAPSLNKQSCETGSLSVMQDHPLFALLLTQGTVGRFVSRLLYIAQKIKSVGENSSKSNISGCFSLQKTAGKDGENFSLGWVQTARGLLIHLANILADKVSQYFIVAPTEWNFHPEGTLNKTLIHSHFSSTQFCEKAVKLAILALDPCIEFNVGVAHA
jgi:hypothetical protein